MISSSVPLTSKVIVFCSSSSSPRANLDILQFEIAFIFLSKMTLKPYIRSFCRCFSSQKQSLSLNFRIPLNHKNNLSFNVKSIILMLSLLISRSIQDLTKVVLSNFPRLYTRWSSWMDSMDLQVVQLFARYPKGHIRQHMNI